MAGGKRKAAETDAPSKANARSTKSAKVDKASKSSSKSASKAKPTTKVRVNECTAGIIPSS